MNGLNGARVLLLDDEQQEAMPIIKAFSKVGVPVVYFEGKEKEFPKIKNKLRGVRLAILDMNLGVTGSNETIASTLVQALSRIISPDNGPYGVLIWTNHPDLKEIVARYVYQHFSLPNPVFMVMLKKADFVRRSGGAGGPKQFSIGKLSGQLVIKLAESSPLECMQSWEGSCFHAATNVTNSLAELTGSTATDLDGWKQAWQEETLKLLLVISRAKAEEHHTLENCIPSIFLALNSLHSDRMDVLVEDVSDDLSDHAAKIMAAQGGSAVVRKARVNTMLHLASSQLDRFSPGNLYIFAKAKKPVFMPSIKDVLTDCIQGGEEQRKENLQAVMGNAHLCGLEITPVCDHAQNKMGLSRIIAGLVLSLEHEKKIKTAQFLKRMGPFYFKSRVLPEGQYALYINSRYVAAAKPSLVKKLRATVRVRPQLLADVQSWASYQAGRQGVMLLK